MPETDAFWDFYWETRLQAMETLGKREAILTASKLVRRLYEQNGRPVRVLELGCGEGQIVGTLLDSHARWCSSAQVAGVDYNPRSLAVCRRDYPGLKFVEGDFTDPALLAGLGKYDALLMVNALHEVFSTTISAAIDEVDVPAAKERVRQTLDSAVHVLEPGGWVVLFDGLEPPSDGQDRLRVRFLSRQAREHFETFAAQYKPFHIDYHPAGDALSVNLSRRDFTRYITKSIFLGKALWKSERFESYQYFREDEFRAAFARAGLEIRSLRTLTVNREKWQRVVQIETPGEDFPQEHILIQAQRSGA